MRAAQARRLAAGLGACIAMAASAQPVACTDAQGRRSYQDAPCAAGSTSRPLAVAGVNTVQAWVRQPRAVQAAAERGVPVPGLTAGELLRMFGRPESEGDAGGRGHWQVVSRGGQRWRVGLVDGAVAQVQPLDGPAGRGRSAERRPAAEPAARGPRDGACTAKVDRRVPAAPRVMQTPWPRPEPLGQGPQARRAADEVPGEPRSRSDRDCAPRARAAGPAFAQPGG